MTINQNSFVVFDLDDTLYKEVDFLKSAYKYISTVLEAEIGANIYDEMLDLWYSRKSVFDIIKAKYNISVTVEQLVNWYRFHPPYLTLDPETKEFLETLKKAGISMGLLTDGRSKTQRNKIKALKLEGYFQPIVISEEIGSQKPNENNYKAFEKFTANSNLQFYYIGDNILKDFVTPNKMNWVTIGLKDQGQNIHSQNIKVKPEYFPTFIVDSFNEIKII